MRKPVDQSFRSASFDSSRVCLDKHLPFPFPPNLQAHKNGRLVVFAGGVHPAALAVGGVIMVGVGAENDKTTLLEPLDTESDDFIKTGSGQT